MSLAPTLEHIIDSQQYPIHALSSPLGCKLLENCHHQFSTHGYVLLQQFMTKQAVQQANLECHRLSCFAKYSVRYTNPYKTEDDPTLPTDHPKRFFARRTNAFISQNHFEEDSIFRVMYHSQSFQQLIAACVGCSRVYEYADPLGGLVLNVLPPGGQHPWHFDENDFSTILMLQPAEWGGVLEIAPNIRTRKNEQFEQVQAVLHGPSKHGVSKGASKHGTSKQRQCIDFNPGDLMILNGNLSLHRVTAVEGSKNRYTAVLSYTRESGVVGRMENNAKIFG